MAIKITDKKPTWSDLKCNLAELSVFYCEASADLLSFCGMDYLMTDYGFDE